MLWRRWQSSSAALTKVPEYIPASFCAFICPHVSHFYFWATVNNILVDAKMPEKLLSVLSGV